MQQDIEQIIRLFINALSKRVKINAAYAFGSRVRGDWLKDSDIDLIVVSEDFNSMPFTKRMDIIEEVQWSIRIRPHIEVVPLTSKEFNEKLNSSTVVIDASRYWKKIL
ncbi:MAG: nucleotidyltransferase domain-containing protein [Nitrososphaeria archaeon]